MGGEGGRGGERGAESSSLGVRDPAQGAEGELASSRDTQPHTWSHLGGWCFWSHFRLPAPAALRWDPPPGIPQLATSRPCAFSLTPWPHFSTLLQAPHTWKRTPRPVCTRCPSPAPPPHRPYLASAAPPAPPPSFQASGLPPPSPLPPPPAPPALFLALRRRVWEVWGRVWGVRGGRGVVEGFWGSLGAGAGSGSGRGRGRESPGDGRGRGRGGLGHLDQVEDPPLLEGRGSRGARGVGRRGMGLVEGWGRVRGLRGVGEGGGSGSGGVRGRPGGGRGPRQCGGGWGRTLGTGVRGARGRGGGHRLGGGMRVRLPLMALGGVQLGLRGRGDPGGMRRKGGGTAGEGGGGAEGGRRRRRDGGGRAGVGGGAEEGAGNARGDSCNCC